VTDGHPEGAHPEGAHPETAPPAERTVETAYGPIGVAAWGARIFRARFFGPPEVPDASYVAPPTWGATGDAGARTATLDDGTVEVATPHGALRLHPGAPAVSFLDADGSALIPAPAGAAAGVARERVQDPVTGEERWRVRLALPRPTAAETHCYGLGQGGGAQLDRLTLLIYPPATGDVATVLYEDDGRSRDYGQGHRAVTTFRVRAQPDGLRLEAGPVEGRFRGQPAGREVALRVWMGRPVERVEVGHGVPGAPGAAEPASAARVADAAAAGAEPGAAWWQEGPLLWVRQPRLRLEEALSVVVR
jgi:hypothetical protein